MATTLRDLAESVATDMTTRSPTTTERMRTDTYLAPHKRYTADRHAGRFPSQLREPVRTSAGTCPSCDGPICAMTGECRCST